MNAEEWRQVPRYPDYWVSDQGRVLSLRRGHSRILRPRPAGKGYWIVSLYDDGGRRSRYIHHLVLLAFVGPRPSDQEVRHLNGDKADNRLGNLRYGSSSENHYDQVLHGTHHNAVKVRCKRGHRFNADNTYVNAGKRNCRTCTRERAQARALAAANIRSAAA